MKLIKKSTLTIMALFFMAMLTAQTTWTLDKNHSKIRFTAVHYVITEVEGDFREFDGTITTSSEDFDGAEVEFIAKISSIDTNNERRDKHLKSDDFFNAEKFPDLKFKGKFKKEEGKYYLIGDFTMRDITKPIKFDVKYNGTISLGDRGRKAGFKITGTIDRFEFGLKYDRVIEAVGLVVSREIGITCNLELNESK